MDQLRTEHKETLLRHLLVIEEDDATRSACIEIAIQNGFYAYGLSRIGSMQEFLRSHSSDFLLLGMTANREDLQLIQEIKTLKPDTVIIAMTASPAIDIAVEALRRGATDYLTKPFLMEEFSAALERAKQHQQLKTASFSSAVHGTDRIGNLVGCSPEMEKLYGIMSKSALSHHPVLIVGESGTGKELVARTMHAQSGSAEQPFLTVNCAAPDSELLEYELFGQAEGTSASTLHSEPNVLVRAECGTILLDEIGQLSHNLQTRLLRVLREKEIRLAGMAHGIPVRARILAATTVDLAAAVAKGIFHKDLYHRLNVVTLRIPPLRERRSDIPLLINHFLQRMGHETGESYILRENVLRSLVDYDWPLNVRELESLIERACTMASGSIINMIDLPTYVQNYQLQLLHSARPNQESAPEMEQGKTSASLVSLAEVEKQAILKTIEQLHGDKLLAARLLGIGKTTLYRKLKGYGFSETTQPRNWDSISAH